jgi:hypothetical protein
LILLAGIVLPACQKEAMNRANGQTASFKVRMTDAPGNFTGLYVQLTRVDAYIEQQGWVNLSTENRLISVLDLTNGAETTLSLNEQAVVGTYSKLKLTFGTDNSLLIYGGSATIGLSFSSPASDEVIIDINEEVSAGTTTEVLLDFNVAESVWQMGNTYLMHPAISEIEDESTGISGDVQGSIQASVTLFNSEHSYQTYITASGEFLLRGIAEGTYQLSVEGIAQGVTGMQETTVSNIVIVKGQIKTMGAIQL